jgi:hypothetical protein
VLLKGNLHAIFDSDSVSTASVLLELVVSIERIFLATLVTILILGFGRAITPTLASRLCLTLRTILIELRIMFFELLLLIFGVLPIFVVVILPIIIIAAIAVAEGLLHEVFGSVELGSPSA